MPKYRVTHVFHVDAPDVASAVQVSGEPDEVRVRLKSWPVGRFDDGVDYVQPLSVLDLAWDEYMDRTLPAELSSWPDSPRLPGLVDLMSQHRGNPVELSLLFDAAITAYREYVERDELPA